MTAYYIANGTAGALTDVNAGGTDVPAGTAVDAVTLTSTELVAVLGTAGVFVSMTTPTDPEKFSGAETIYNFGDAASGTFTIFNGTGSQLSNVNTAGDDVPAYSTGEEIDLSADELDALLTIEGVAVTTADTDYAEKRLISRVAMNGTLIR